MPFTAAIKVRFSDIDNAGIVYYPRYFDYIHQAFEDLFNDHFRVPYADVLQGDKVGFPAVHTEADYRHPLSFGDVAMVEVGVERLGNKSADFAYTVRRGKDGPVCCEARITVCAVDMRTFTAIPIPERYRRLFTAYREEGS